MTLSSDEAVQQLQAEDLLAGSRVVHTLPVPQAILNPAAESSDGAVGGYLRLRPMTIMTLTLISRAAHDDPSLVPLLMIKEALVEPALSLDQVRQLSVGLVAYLTAQINLISGLSADGEALTAAVESPIGRIHLLLAHHFGWTPEQVAQLTPGQVAVYLAGIEKLLTVEPVSV